MIKEKYQEIFEKAYQKFKIADRMAYVSFSILGESRLFIKILEELYKSTTYLISALLQYEYSQKNITLYKDPKLNLKVFKEKVALKYLDENELENLIKILLIGKKHQNSEMEFVKNNKFVILINDQYEVLTIERLKEFISLLRKILLRTKFE